MAFGDFLRNVLSNTFTTTKKEKNPNYAKVNDKVAGNSTLKTNKGDPDQYAPKEKKPKVNPNVLNADYEDKNDSVYSQNGINSNQDITNSSQNKPVTNEAPASTPITTPENVENKEEDTPNNKPNQNNEENEENEQQEVPLTQTFSAPQTSLASEFNIPIQSPEDETVLSSLIDPPASFLAKSEQQEAENNKENNENEAKNEESVQELTIGNGENQTQDNEPQVSIPPYPQREETGIANPRLDENNSNFYERFDRLIGNSALKNQLNVENYLDSLEQRIKNNPNDINAMRQYVFALRNRDKIQQEIDRIHQIDDDRNIFFNSQDFINPLWEMLESLNPITVDDINSYFNTAFNTLYGYDNNQYGGNNSILFQRDNINPNIFYYNPDGTLNKNKTMQNLIQRYGLANVLNSLIHRNGVTGEGRIDLNPIEENNNEPNNSSTNE